MFYAVKDSKDSFYVNLTPEVGMSSSQLGSLATDEPSLGQINTLAKRHRQMSSLVFSIEALLVDWVGMLFLGFPF